MKQTRRIPALLLAVVMVFSLSLAGCKKEAPIPGDQVAVALFEMILKDDASKIVELFGYADEAEARSDMGMNGSLYEELAVEMTSQFSAMGMTVSNEEMQEFVDAFISMFKNVTLTAKVKQSDEKAGTAVVTCTINTFDADAMTDAMTQVVTDIMSNEELLTGDEDALYSAMLRGMSEAIAGITPTENTADFDVDFELADMDVNGTARKVWVPKDTEKFGEQLSTTAMGG